MNNMLHEVIFCVKQAVVTTRKIWRRENPVGAHKLEPMIMYISRD